jgi:hypothetical protein
MICCTQLPLGGTVPPSERSVVPMEHYVTYEGLIAFITMILTVIMVTIALKDK